MVNIAVCDDVIETLTRFPELHDQSHWASGEEVNREDVKDVENVTIETCGTTACLAGWASIKYFNLLPQKREWDGGWVEFFYMAPRGHDWETAGCEALGIDFETGRALFYMTNESAAIDALRDLRDGVEEDLVRERIRGGHYYGE